MGLKSSWTFRHKARCREQEPRSSRRWRHIAIVALSPLLCSLSTAQLFLSVLLFTYLEIPQAVMVGQLIALIASIICLGLQAFFWFLTCHFRATHGLRDRTSYRQNLFMSLHLMFTSIWWISCLNGAYLFGFNKAPKGCTPNTISADIMRVTSPCQVYQVSLGTSVPAFICSFFQLVLFVRCKRPFLSFGAIFRKRSSPSLLSATETVSEPASEISTVYNSIIKDDTDLEANSAVTDHHSFPSPPNIPPPCHSRPHSWLLPDLEKQLSDADQTCCLSQELDHLPDSKSTHQIISDLPPARARSHCHTLSRNSAWAEDFEASLTPTMSRSQSCSSTLVDPTSRRSSMKLLASTSTMHLPPPPPHPVSNTIPHTDAPPALPPPALLAEAPRFAPIRWSMLSVGGSSPSTSERADGEGM